MRYLKQNTDQYVSIGMALDKTAGFGNEDALTVTSFSGVLVRSTHASASDHIAFTPSATAANDWGMVAMGHGGLYDLKIPDSEINFVGSCILAIWYDAEALPIWHEFMVVPANVFDALMGTDKLQVDTVEISSDSTAADNCELMFDGTGYAGGTAKLGVNVINVNGTAQTAGDVVADVAAIHTHIDDIHDTDLPAVKTVVDDIHTDVGTAITNIGDVHATDLPAVMSMLTDIHNTDLPAVKTQTQDIHDTLDLAHTDIDAILADTNELQVDNVNGGRTDLLIDAIKAKTDLIPATPANEATLTDIHTDVGIAITNIADLHTDIGTAITNIGDIHATDLPAVMSMLTDIHNTDLPDLHTDIGTAISDIAAVHVHVADIHDTDLPAVKADTAAILVDTGTTLDGAIATIDGIVDAIKAKTDNLPSDPADQSAVEAAITAAASPLATASALTTVDATVDLIEDILRNKLAITDASGAATLYADDNATPLFTCTITDNSTTTTRTRLA
jgi:hypothetical protein